MRESEREREIDEGERVSERREERERDRAR